MEMILDKKQILVIFLLEFKWVIKQGRQLANIDNALDLPGDSMVKNLPVNIGDVEYLSLIPGSGRSLGEGNGNPLQYSCLENPMDRGAWRGTVHGVTSVRHNWQLSSSSSSILSNSQNVVSDPSNICVKRNIHLNHTIPAKIISKWIIYLNIKFFFLRK